MNGLVYVCVSVARGEAQSAFLYSTYYIYVRYNTPQDVCTVMHKSPCARLDSCQIARLNLDHGYFAPRLVQPFIPLGLVN